MNLLELSPNAFKLLFILRSFCNSSGECWPGQDKLLELVGIARQSVLWKALKELEEKRLVNYKMYYTSTASRDGKKYPKRHIIYKLVNDSLYLTSKSDNNKLNLQFSAGKLHSGKLQDVVIRVVSNKRNIIDPVLPTGDQELTAKNSLTPLTKEERYEIALALKVSPEEVERVANQVLNPENIAKYRHKTTFYTTKKWIDRRIDDGKLQTLDANGLSLLKTLEGEI